MIRTHKIRLYPTETREESMVKTVGTVRYVYNWALERWTKLYESDQDTSAYILDKLWTEERPEWSKEVNRCSQNRAIQNLEKAFKNFFDNRAEYPKFHKKGRNDSFYVANDKGYIDSENQRIHLPKIGKVKMAEQLRFEGKIMSYIVNYKADQWHVCVQVDLRQSIKNCAKPNTKIGVDVGIKNIAATSEGHICKNPKYLKKREDKISRLFKVLSRQEKGSNRYKKTKKRISKCYLSLYNKRKDLIHKFTSKLAEKYDTVIIEDLSVERMKSENTFICKSIQDTAMKEVHRQLEYKSNNCIKAPEYFPSSKRCSNCGNIKENLSLEDRVYKCDCCGIKINRDINAAINLKSMPWVTGSTST